MRGPVRRDAGPGPAIHAGLCSLTRMTIHNHGASAKNISCVALDQGGRLDGVQVMWKRATPLSAICSDGFSVIDVRDPKKPKTVAFVPRRRIPARTICKSTATSACDQRAEHLGACSNTQPERLFRQAADRFRQERPALHRRHARLRISRSGGAARDRLSPCQAWAPHRIWWVGGAMPMSPVIWMASSITSWRWSTWPIRRGRSSVGSGGCPA